MRIGWFTPAYGGYVRVEQEPSLLQDFVYCHNAGIEWRHFTHDVQPIDRSRNLAVARAREAGCDRLLMLDADVWADPGGSALEQLMAAMDSHGAHAVGAVVMHRHGTHPMVAPVRPNEVYPCEVIATALLLLDLRALDRLAPDHVWFRYQLADNGVDVVAGEDVHFCRELARLGGVLVANFQIPTRHYSGGPLRLERALCDPVRSRPPTED